MTPLESLSPEERRRALCNRSALNDRESLHQAMLTGLGEQHEQTLTVGEQIEFIVKNADLQDLFPELVPVPRPAPKPRVTNLAVFDITMSLCLLAGAGLVVYLNSRMVHDGDYYVLTFLQCLPLVLIGIFLYKNRKR